MLKFMLVLSGSSALRLYTAPNEVNSFNVLLFELMFQVFFFSITDSSLHKPLTGKFQMYQKAVSQKIFIG